MLLYNHLAFKYLSIALFFLSGLQTISSAQSLKYSTSLFQNKDWSFVENKGQIAPTLKGDQKVSDIKYYGHQGGVYLYFRKDRISFVFTKVEQESEQISEATGRSVETQCLRLNLASAIPHGPRLPGDAFNASLQRKITTSRMDLVLVNSNPSTQILASDQQEYYENYYTTGNADSGITNVHTFKTLTYKNLYPHIDMVLTVVPSSAKASAGEEGMEYSFVVYPGGNVSDIQMRWEGIEGIPVCVGRKKLEDFKIEYANALGKIDEGAPYSYVGADPCVRPASGSRADTRVRPYSTQSKIESQFVFYKKNNSIGFNVGAYDKGKVLVIDPTLEWGTYFGGKPDDDGAGISTDKNGNVYCIGLTQSQVGIATSGTYKTAFSGNTDAYISKFDTKGKLLWGTYFGSLIGGGGPFSLNICTVDSGNAVISCSVVDSFGIATSGAYQTSYAGGYSDAFIAKFNSKGNLIWGSYFGGPGQDICTGLSCNKNGDINITGLTQSRKGIATSGAQQTVFRGSGESGFLAKFNSQGHIMWATYFGGSGTYNQPDGIAVDSLSNIIITGFTNSTTGIATSGAYRTIGGGTTNGDADYDIFVAKYSYFGKLIWSTYFGEPDTVERREDGAGAITTDLYNNIYIAGESIGPGGLATSGAWQTQFHGSSCIFLAKFNSNDSLIWATYYGAGADDECGGLCVGPDNDIFMSGSTLSSSLIATTDGYKNTKNGSEDAFLARFSKSGDLKWATYYGGDQVTWGAGLASDMQNNIFITGTTECITGIATNGAYQTSFNNNDDAFIVKFNFNVKNDAGITSILSPNGTLCQSSQNVMVQLKDFGNAELDSVKINWSLNGKLQKEYNWKGKLLSDSVIAVTISIDSFPPGTDTIKAWTSLPNGFKDSVPENDSSANVFTVYQIPQAFTGPDTTICFGSKISLGNSGVAGDSYTWTSFPKGFVSNSSDPTISPDTTTSYYLTEIDPGTGCQKKDSVKIMVTGPRGNAGGNHAICAGDSIALGSHENDGQVDYWSWISSDNVPVSAVQNPVVKPVGNTTYYMVETQLNSTCVRRDSAVITIDHPQAIISKDKSICMGSSTGIGGTFLNGYTYLWSSVPTGFTSTMADPLIHPTRNTNYYLKETDNLGCSKTDSVEISLLPLPKPDAGPGKIICSKQTVLIGSNKTIPGDYYSWHIGKTNNFPALPVISVTPDSSGWYVVTATDSVTGCSGSDSLFIYAYPLPKPHITGLTVICDNLVHSYITPFDSGSKYNWKTGLDSIIYGQGTDSIRIKPSIATEDLKVTETDTNGCINSDSVTINRYLMPSAHWTVLSDSPTYTFKALDSTEQYYQWQFWDGGTGYSYLVNHKYDFDKDSSVDVSLTVGSAFGCSATFDSAIKIHYIPPPNFYIEVFPTPFGQTTNIKITLEKSSHIQISAYDAIGRYVGKLADIQQPVGVKDYEFNAAQYRIAYGVYYFEILVDGKLYTRQVVRVE